MQFGDSLSIVNATAISTVVACLVWSGGPVTIGCVDLASATSDCVSTAMTLTCDHVMNGDDETTLCLWRANNTQTKITAKPQDYTK